MHRGYFALWRKYQDHPFWKEKREFSKAEAWLDILWAVQHTEDPQEVILGMTVLVCNYGESLKSLETWSKRWGWNKSRVRRFLQLLENMAQIRHSSERKTTRITVLNYKQYDPRRNANDTQMKRKRNASETQATPEKNVKNEKNEKNTTKEKNIKRKFDVFSFRPNHISEKEWSDLVNHRRSVKSIESERAYSAVVKQLNLATTKGHTVGECIDEICNRSWKGFKAEWMDNNNGNGKPQTQRERHNDIREQYAKDLLTTRYGDEFTGDRSNEKLGH